MRARKNTPQYWREYRLEKKQAMEARKQEKLAKRQDKKELVEEFVAILHYQKSDALMKIVETCQQILNEREARQQILNEREALLK